MRILGLSDGLDGGAALAVDDHIAAAEHQSSFDRTERSRAFPWEAVDDVLARTSTAPEDIRTIAVAGRITPPFFLRRRPTLRRLFGDAFSSALDLGVFYQAMLRQTGLAALEADRAADWLSARFAGRGFPAKLYLVDIHTALANAAYRTQDDDDLLIVTLHPLGDGVSFAVHLANVGQIDRIFEQKGFSTLHVHLARCARALGFDDVLSMWKGVGPTTDPELMAVLADHLYVDVHKLSHARYPLPQDGRVYDLLRRADPAVGAASVRANLSNAVVELVRYHVRQHDRFKVAVNGDVFHDRRLVADLAAIPEVESVYCPEDPGSGSLALGAALHAAGTAPTSALGPATDPRLPTTGAPVDAVEIASWLEAGEDVAVFGGASGSWSWHRGDRCIWSLAERGRPAVRELPDGLEPSVSKLRPALRAGSALPRTGDGERKDLVLADEGLLADVTELLGRPVHLRRMKLGGTRVASLDDAERCARVERVRRLVVAGRLR